MSKHFKSEFPSYEDLEARIWLLEAEKKLLLEALIEVDECAEYWSEYDVPLGIHDRIKSAIKRVSKEKLQGGL